MSLPLVQRAFIYYWILGTTLLHHQENRIILYQRDEKQLLC